MFNPDLDAKNTESFFAYTDSEIYKHLIHQKIRKVGSYKHISMIDKIKEIYPLLGYHDTFAVNYQSKTSGWATVTAGWNDRGYPVNPFRYIDFLNILLGAYRSGSAVALTDKHKDNIKNIRIDFDFENYTGKAAVTLAKEIEEKLATIGMDCYIFATGGRGVQAIIPLPCDGGNPIARSTGLVLWKKLKPYLDTNHAHLDKCSLDSYLRLPLGIHATSNNLSLYISPETESYVSHIDQLVHFKNSWQWTMPIHITDAIDSDAFAEAAEQDFKSIPDAKTTHTVVKPSQSKLPRNNNWAQTVWDARLELKPGSWQRYLLNDYALHAAYVLFGDSAIVKLEELAAQIPTNKPSDVEGRIRVVRHLWGSFNPIQLPTHTSKTLALMMTTRISTETYAEADLLFKYLQSKKTSTTRWVNEQAHDYILAVLHGINCSESRTLTLTIDELLIYIQQTLFSSMVRMTLRRIITKSTLPHHPIRTRNMPPSIRKNDLAVFLYDPGKKIFVGATPGRFERVPGLKKKAMKSTEMSDS